MTGQPDEPLNGSPLCYLAHPTYLQMQKGVTLHKNTGFFDRVAATKSASTGGYVKNST